MKLLLDTHVWLWALHDPSRLSQRVRDVLRNPANRGVAFSGFNLGSVVAECQRPDSAPCQLVRVADRSDSAPAGSASLPRNRADRPVAPAATTRSRRSISSRHRSNPGPHASDGGRQSASLGNNPDDEELIAGVSVHDAIAPIGQRNGSGSRRRCLGCGPNWHTHISSARLVRN